jgi:hypothetical protein
MSVIRYDALNQFTIPQLKKIVVYTGIGEYVKTSVNKDILIDQMEKYLHFDGYNFTIKETQQQKMLKPQTLEITNKKIPKKDKGTKDTSSKGTKDTPDFKEIKKVAEDTSSYVGNYIKKIKDLSQQLKNNPVDKEEMHPKKKNIKIFNKRPNVIKEETFEF